MSLQIQTHGKGYLVTGDTKDYKETLKSLGGSWNRGLQGWVFSKSRYDELTREFGENLTQTTESSETNTTKSKPDSVGALLNSINAKGNSFYPQATTPQVTTTQITPQVTTTTLPTQFTQPRSVELLTILGNSNHTHDYLIKMSRKVPLRYLDALCELEDVIITGSDNHLVHYILYSEM